MKARLKQLQEEAEKLGVISTESEKNSVQEAEDKKLLIENERKEADLKSVFVGNVSYCLL